MKFIPVLAAALMAGSALAQVSQCILTCSTQAAAAAGCASFADASCVCTSATFQNTAGACLIANCTEAEQQSSRQLQAALCGSQSVTSGAVTNTLPSATASTSLPPLGSISGVASVSAPASASASSGAGGSASATTSRASSSGAPPSSAANPSSSTSSAANAASSSPRSAAGKLEPGVMGFKGLIGAGMGVLGVVMGGLAIL